MQKLELLVLEQKLQNLLPDEHKSEVIVHSDGHWNSVATDINPKAQPVLGIGVEIIQHLPLDDRAHSEGIITRHKLTQTHHLQNVPQSQTHFF